MSKEKNVPAPGMDFPDVAADPLNDLILEMFLKKDIASLPDPDDIDPEQLANALTKEDREALAALGSSEELIGRIVAAAGAIPAGEQEKLQTIHEPVETIAESDSPFYGQDATQEHDKMISDVERFAKQHQVTFLSGYRKSIELGRGGQGTVYRIEGEDEFSATFALKVFFPGESEQPADFAEDMMRMRRIASQIHHHPQGDLVGINWFGQHDDVYMMRMEYIDGFDLRRLLQPQLLQLLKQCVGKQRWKDITRVVYSVNGSEQLALQPGVAVYIIEHVLRGLGALHARDIVHGDIKPSNIMLNASGSVKIIDVGSAFEGSSPPERPHVTPAYAAPEFLKTGRMSKQSDLASVGYMLIEMLTGKPITDSVADPDESTKSIDTGLRQQLLDAKQTLPDRLPKILPSNVLASDHLVELCRCLIDPDLSRRFSSAAKSIVDCKGTYEFSKELVVAKLDVCSYHEVSQWLADVKQATRPDANAAAQ